MPGSILGAMIAALTGTMHAVSRFDHRQGDPRVYRLLCREMADAMDDLYDELHRPEHRGRLVLGSLVILADDEGLLHFRENGPWPPAWQSGPGAS